MKSILLFLFLSVSLVAQNKNADPNLLTVFEKSNGLETGTYEQVIAYYQLLAKSFPQISLDSIGMTDSGKPLHIATYNPDALFDFEKIRATKQIMLINNGIHPGEPDGIDATMLLFRDLAQGKLTIPKHTVLVTIPIYNVGGSLNRNSTSRTNQDGPIAYGFRGNARNYDLNRDFIKLDTKNARTFTQIYHLVQPAIFIDNHVSNGADYQYTLTHLFTQHNKLGGALGNYIHTEMTPSLEQKLATRNWDITPYVNVFNKLPEAGFSQFNDSPRYSTGYTALFNSLGMMVETHMLKPYKPRVEGTYELIKSMLDIVERDHQKIKMLRENAMATLQTAETYPLAWTIDTTKTSILKFKGYEGKMVPSTITGSNRLFYDRTKPFTREVTYQNYFKPSSEVTIPKAYIIPQGWWNVIEVLKLNQVEMRILSKDTTIAVEQYKIEKFQTRKEAYEGHYQHYNTNVIASQKDITFKKGDYLIATNQKAFRYLLETLEPVAPDSFFNWNFFDTILQQKEGFSPYVWEDMAAELLKNNSALQLKFENKKKSDIGFSNNWYAQLDWLHKQSENYEKEHLQYPVYRVL
ncbi:zinc carboxypeptidase [Gelidibacter sediminis]|uniref:Zinc carboxypeptidase n=1 Tax=Gelidibacter sediminis TaxID=1608710 RepID=A0A4R7PKU1_9FLAO|nr:M14 family metallopeptidase [Gelidibacter sediminis]TDU34200.1 zinc carboxypeptidase [Gelidibacter sediminis]